MTDAAMPTGVNGATKVLQKTLNQMQVPDDNGRSVLVDGGIGQKTLEAANNAVRMYGAKEVANNFQDNLKNHYDELVIRNPKKRDFFNGWLKRADDAPRAYPSKP